MEEMNRVDKEALIGKLTDNLEELLKENGLDIEALGKMAGIEVSRINRIVSGSVKMKWSEYLSIVFVLWSSAEGKKILENYGLFPSELREAFSVDRNEHAPDTGVIHAITV
ncbi:MAG: helix-turn-helix transcriptional regulator [Lachnospiraceae bacterium]|nr:helix-turn-helix transcriptional regulator [Lachnospiraceae bacterium]